MTDLYLVAYLANAHDEAEPLLAVATCNAAGDWHTTCDQRIWPYWTQALEVDYPAPPEGWVEHLVTEAQRYAAKRREEMRPSGLAALLAAKRAAAPQPAPIKPLVRRGF